VALVSRCCTCAANKNVSSREVVRVRAAQLVGCRAVQLSFATHTPNYITVVSFIDFRSLSISGYARKTESSSSTKRSSQSPLASLLCVSEVLNSRGVHPPLQPVALPRLAFEIDQFAPGQTDDYGRAGGWPIASPRRDAATPAPAQRQLFRTPPPIALQRLHLLARSRRSGAAAIWALAESPEGEPSRLRLGRTRPVSGVVCRGREGPINQAERGAGPTPVWRALPAGGEGGPSVSSPCLTAPRLARRSPCERGGRVEAPPPSNAPPRVDARCPCGRGPWITAPRPMGRRWGIGPASERVCERLDPSAERGRVGGGGGRGSNGSRAHAPKKRA